MAQTSSELLKSFSEGNQPANVRKLAARGLLPLAPNELLLLLVRLARDPVADIAQTAKETLAHWSVQEVVSYLQSTDCDPEVFDHFSHSSASAIQEAIILNPKASTEVISKLASSVAAPLLEAILYNRMRLLEFPEILQNVKRNPAATSQILGLVHEIETEFFGSKKRTYEAAPSDAPAPAAEPALELEAELPPDDLSLEGLPVDPQEREAALLRRIGSMTVRQRIQLALSGPREARAVLVRDTNKEVARTVLQSPKLMANEVEAFAAMRNVADDVLRHIGSSKTWTRSYAVVHNLVKNPKTPPMISQRMLSRLRTKDLVLLARDRGVTEPVRRGADRLAKQRQAGRAME